MLGLPQEERGEQPQCEIAGGFRDPERCLGELDGASGITDSPGVVRLERRDSSETQRVIEPASERGSALEVSTQAVDVPQSEQRVARHDGQVDRLADDVFGLGDAFRDRGRLLQVADCLAMRRALRGLPPSLSQVAKRLFPQLGGDGVAPSRSTCSPARSA